MLKTYTARYAKLSAGYTGPIAEWPEVVTEGKSIEECRKRFQDALHEMIIACQHQNKAIPIGGALEELPV
jgi:predicted RNase H-like HicB family nuclease